jgi:hypothetical protein
MASVLIKVLQFVTIAGSVAGAYWIHQRLWEPLLDRLAADAKSWWRVPVTAGLTVCLFVLMVTIPISLGAAIWGVPIHRPGLQPIPAALLAKRSLLLAFLLGVVTALLSLAGRAIRTHLDSKARNAKTRPQG